MKKQLFEKSKEAVFSILPIMVIVLALHFFVSPLPLGMLIMFLVSSVVLVFGMGLFSLGADMSMLPMGEHVGSKLIQSRKIWLMALVCFVLGMLVTLAEPDLAVLAKQVSSVPSIVLMLFVAIGCGIFLVIAMLRILFQIKFSYLMLGFYALIFVVAIFVPERFVAIAFDSGGVTTGPITVPFIMSLGVGMVALKSGDNSTDDSFGFVSLCSVGPIIAVLLLSLFFDTTQISHSSAVYEEIDTIWDVFNAFGHELPGHLFDVFIALMPIVVFFGIAQVATLKLPKKRLIQMAVGIGYTFVGLVIFLNFISIGYMSVGSYLGTAIASLDYPWILIPMGMLFGFFIVAAEPAVHILNKQVEEISGGTVSRKAMFIGLSTGVAAAVGLSMVRVLTGLSIWYLVLPGYAIALLLTFFVPNIFTAIAFDSGGVASGAMTAAFLLPFALGASEALGGDAAKDAFGLVGLVAMTPLIAIQVVGLIGVQKQKKAAKAAKHLPVVPEIEIIEFEV